MAISLNGRLVRKNCRITIVIFRKDAEFLAGLDSLTVENEEVVMALAILHFSIFIFAIASLHGFPRRGRLVHDVALGVYNVLAF